MLNKDVLASLAISSLLCCQPAIATELQQEALKQLHYLLSLLPIGAMYFARLLTSVKRQRSYDKVPLFIIFLIISIALFLMPKLSLTGGDREILQYIPSAYHPVYSCLLFSCS
jgi:MFS superfamily sulfate permease-like transporter